MLIINNRDRVEWRDGMTVQDVLKAMNYGYSLMTVTIDDELVPEDEWVTRKVEDEARITVFHLAHGG